MCSDYRECSNRQTIELKAVGSAQLHPGAYNSVMGSILSDFVMSTRPTNGDRPVFLFKLTVWNVRPSRSYEIMNAWTKLSKLASRH
jgi:hypothetical protein